jgi:integrase
VPATPRGHVRRLPSGKVQLRYYDADGVRRTGGVYPSRSAAFAHYRDVIEPRLHGTDAALTFDGLCEQYLARLAPIRSPRTIATLRERLVRPRAAFGDVPLALLAGQGAAIADWRASLPPRYAPQVMGAYRQVCAAAVRWGYMTRNPAADAGENPAPPPRAVRAFTPDELAALDAELDPAYAPLVPLAAATGLRPAEWAALTRADVDTRGRVLHVRGTKTAGSVRQVPLTARALGALDRLPLPLAADGYLFPRPGGGPLDLDNFRARVWTPAVKASGVRTPARLYDLRATFASNALAAGVTPFELAKVMGTSVRMLERHYGTLIAGAGAGIAARLDAHDAAVDAQADLQRKEMQP